MQADRIADEARLAGSVRGLGVCDVLRVELAAVQRAGLIAELATQAAALETRRTGLEAAARARTSPPRVDNELDEVWETLRLLARVRENVEEQTHGAIVLTGPAGLVLELVDGALASAVGDLDARLKGSDGSSGVVCETRLKSAAAWIVTALECRAVEAYCVDPGVDPVRAR